MVNLTFENISGKNVEKKNVQQFRMDADEPFSNPVDTRLG
jgi:hypothetical protein